MYAGECVCGTIAQVYCRRKADSCWASFEVANKELCYRDSEDDGDDAILVDRGMLIARTEEPIEDVTTTRRF